VNELLVGPSTAKTPYWKNDCSEETTMVTGSDKRQQCTRSWTRRFHSRWSSSDRPVLEEFSRVQRPKEGRAISLRNVNAHILHQSIGYQTFSLTAGTVGDCKGRTSWIIRKVPATATSMSRYANQQAAYPNAIRGW